MKYAILDSLGAVSVMLAMALPIGCVRVPAAPTDLQPLIAVSGLYATMSHTDQPTGTCSNCGTKVPPGGGWVGDGTIKVPCPECNPQSASWVGK